MGTQHFFTVQVTVYRLEEAENFTEEEETDTDGMGFESPNLPVYFGSPLWRGVCLRGMVPVWH